MEVVLAAGAFVGLFGAFVIAPTVIQKRHHARKEEAEPRLEFAPAGDE
jgi:hypothetical protein